MSLNNGSKPTIIVEIRSGIAYVTSSTQRMNLIMIDYDVDGVEPGLLSIIPEEGLPPDQAIISNEYQYDPREAIRISELVKQVRKAESVGELQTI